MAKRKSQEWRDKISASKKGKIPYIATERTRALFREAKMGDKNPNWRGGITSEDKRIRESAEYRQWRKTVFERDNYTCVNCGDNTGGNLEADHIKPRKLYPDLVFDVDNGRTLCYECHRNTPTWGNKANH